MTGEPQINGKWRMEQLERATSELRAEVTAIGKELAVHRQQTSDFMAQTRERWRTDELQRVERQKESDDEITRVKRLATWALLAFVTMLLGFVGNAIILIAQGGP